MIAYVLNKFKGWLALIGAGLVALLYAYARGRRVGGAAAQQEAQRQTTKTLDKFNEIDRKRPDFDASIGRLRDRSKKG